MAGEYGPLAADPTSDNNAALREAFKARFGLDENEIDVIKKVLGTSTVLPWWKAFKAYRSAVKSMPPQFRAAGLSLEEWQEYVTNPQTRREIRDRVSQERTGAAQDCKLCTEALERDAAAQLEAINTPP